MQLWSQLWFQIESKTLIQEDLYKTRFVSKYVGYWFQDEFMTAIICFVIKNFFFLSIRTEKKKNHANSRDISNIILAYTFLF